ncbi:MAG: AMP-binding protein [Alphaproteobacteria bacterium]
MHDVIAALARNAEADPSRIAICDGRLELCWKQLERRVAGSAARIARLPRTIGLIADNGIDWAIADLAIAAAGHTFVPLPTMFSDDQLDHVMRSSGVELLLFDPTNEARARRLTDAVAPLEQTDGEHLPNVAAEAKRIIYTSGTTGQPKGVVLGDRQLSAMTQSLARAIGADMNDLYMSVLPFSLLLEELCGIHVPVLVGGHCYIASEVLPAIARGDAGALAAAAATVRPTVTVLVPELLRAWVGALTVGGMRGPDSLRFVAVGGAPVPPNVAQAAWSLGLPVYEGYGLSECCSVVALNRPDTCAAGTAGTPLDDVTVMIEDGEIVVEGPTVMDGYLGGARVGGRWHTGDLGSFDDAGRLVVQGRRDSVLVTANGRNIQPEWIETMLTGDPRIARAVVIGHGAPHLTAIVVPTAAVAATLTSDTGGRALAIIAQACASAPPYAIPRQAVVVTEAAMHRDRLLSPGGRPRRQAIAACFGGTTDPIESKKDVGTI